MTMDFEMRFMADYVKFMVYAIINFVLEWSLDMYYVTKKFRELS